MNGPGPITGQVSTPGGSGSPQLPAFTWADGDSGTISAGQFVTNNDPDIDGTTAILLSNSVIGVAQWASLANPSFIIFTNSAGVSSRFLIGSISENATSIQLGVTYKASNAGTWNGLYTVSFTPANIGLGLTGILKSDGNTASAAAAGTDYIAPNGSIASTSGINSDIGDSLTALQNAVNALGTQIDNEGVPADTGWTANQSAGDKTVAVQNYDSTTLDGMTAGLNLVLAGFGTAIAELADQVELLTKKFQAIESALANRVLPNA